MSEELAKAEKKLAELLDWTYWLETRERVLEHDLETKAHEQKCLSQLVRVVLNAYKQELVVANCWSDQAQAFVDKVDSIAERLCRSTPHNSVDGLEVKRKNSSDGDGDGESGYELLEEIIDLTPPLPRLYQQRQGSTEDGEDYADDYRAAVPLNEDEDEMDDEDEDGDGDLTVSLTGSFCSSLGGSQQEGSATVSECSSVSSVNFSGEERDQDQQQDSRSGSELVYVHDQEEEQTQQDEDEDEDENKQQEDEAKGEEEEANGGDEDGADSSRDIVIPIPKPAKKQVQSDKVSSRNKATIQQLLASLTVDNGGRQSHSHNASVSSVSTTTTTTTASTTTADNREQGHERRWYGTKPDVDTLLSSLQNTLQNYGFRGQFTT